MPFPIQNAQQTQIPKQNNHKVTFSVEVLETYQGKKLGVPKPDSDGYYSMCIGALNARSRNQCYYDTKSIYDQITQPNSPFNMMLTQGHLYGEFGHPDEDAPITRLEVIREKDRSHHFRKIWCGEEDQNGIIPIYASLKPVLPHGPALEQSILNKWENTAFSLRSLMKYTWDAERKAQYRTILRLVTFDHVNTPGFLEASKRNALGIESMSLVSKDLTLEDFFDSSGNRLAAFESFSNEDLSKLFNVKDFDIFNIQGKYIPNSTTYIDVNNKKQSLIHSLLMNRRHHV